MITYAKFFHPMAYLIKPSMSGLCDKYLQGRGLIIFSKVFLLAGLTSPNFALSGEKITIPMDLSTWLYKGNKFECNLMHSNIPQGKFYFLAEPNNQVTFIADVHNNNNKWNNVLLLSESAPWKKELLRKEEASLALTTATNQFAFTHGTESLLKAITSGSWVTLSLSGKNDSAISSVTLPTIQIQNALASFNQCRAQLPKLSYSQARDVNLPFQFGQKTLSRSQQSTIEALYSYISVDDRVTKILVDGHTDNVGSQLANLTVSRQRAEQVAEALVQQGADRSLIEVRAHGSRYPIASNNTQAGQAKNRRVTLRLVRDNERVVAKINVATNNAEAKQQTQQEKVKVQ
ncbi:OmpA family protein [Vibrio owensii]|uniref:MotY family protein n=1 Tax=Vibrio owensii TaxID=696485 RepID=UPI0022209428|nr:OmpA family protein [Vibrio owensii]